MLSRKLPSMTSLRCFESASRHLSFTKAGDELCMTQSAISRQIKKLEDYLGEKLFYRVKQRLQLTPCGESYSLKIRDQLNQIEAATRAICKVDTPRLRVGLEPALATKFLIPKLKLFKEKHQNIEIDLLTDIKFLYKNPESYDIAVLFGDGHWPELDSHFLMKEELIAVCSPTILENYGKASALADIVNFPLLHHTSEPSTSEKWFAEASIDINNHRYNSGGRFEFFNMLVDAALQDMGVAIVPKYFVIEELRSGELVNACEQSLSLKNGYYAVIPKDKIRDSNIKEFASWMKEVIIYT